MDKKQMIEWFSEPTYLGEDGDLFLYANIDEEEAIEKMKAFERELVGDDVDSDPYDIVKITIAPAPENGGKGLLADDEAYMFTWRDGAEQFPGAIEVWARFT